MTDRVIIEQAIFSLLSGTSTITDLVGSRIYAGHPPQEATMPFVVFFRVSEQPADLHHSGGVKHYKPYFQLSVYDSSLIRAKRLAREIRDLFHGYSGTVGGLEIVGAQFVGEQELIDVDAKEYHIPVEIMFMHYEP